MSDDQGLTGPAAGTRRALLTGAGAVGAVVVLAACGSDDSGDEPAPTSGGPAAPSTGGNPEGTQSLAGTADIPVGGGAIYPAQGVVVTQPRPGEFKAFDSICTHQGCPVTNVDGGTINCSCHFSKFSIEDGSVKGGPATKPLAPKNVKVTGDQISLA